MSRYRSDQHRTGPKPSRGYSCVEGDRPHQYVRRSNGDDYCRNCGVILVCYHLPSVTDHDTLTARLAALDTEVPA